MIKKILTLLIAATFLLSLGITAKASNTSATTSYLQGGYAATDPDSQDWAAMALGSVGTVVSVGSTTDTDVLDLARNALGRAAQKENNNTQVSALENQNNNGQFGEAGAINNDIFAILAISTSDSAWLNNHPEVFQALAQNQHTDGSFDFSSSGSGSADLTSAAIWALELNSATTSSNISKAFTYIAAAQNSDGGFGFVSGESSNVATTAWAALAYQSAGQVNIKAQNYLLNTMQSNGSWLFGGVANYLNTSYALMALSGQGMPILFKTTPAPVTSPTTSGGSKLGASSPTTGLSNSNPSVDTPNSVGALPSSNGQISTPAANSAPASSSLKTPNTSTKIIKKTVVTTISNTAVNKQPVCSASASAAASAGIDSSGNSYANSTAQAGVACN